jgi:hypothetical protein
MIEQTMTAKPPRERAAAEPNLTPFFATAVGVIVLPLYAAQPLLGLIGTSLAVPVSAYGVIAMMSMVGYAAGLFLLVPLTNLVELRRITLISVAGEMLGLIAAAGAPDGLLLWIAALAVGANGNHLKRLWFLLQYSRVAVRFSTASMRDRCSARCQHRQLRQSVDNVIHRRQAAL